VAELLRGRMVAPSLDEMIAQRYEADLNSKHYLRTL
jgi:hypothetical protein